MLQRKMITMLITVNVLGAIMFLLLKKQILVSLFSAWLPMLLSFFYLYNTLQ